MSRHELHKQTGLISTGRKKSETAHSVAVGPERASTVLFPTYEQFVAKDRPYFYGRFGTGTHRAFEESIAALEQADHVMLAPSGLAAITETLLSFAKPGTHVLITDSAYDPVRHFCDGYLAQRNVEVSYYDPRIGADIAALVKTNSAAILAESPGSLTFEIQDIPALSEVARDHQIPLIVDNTWGAGLHCCPLALGADVSIIAATKYLVGHADCLMGTIAVRDEKLADKIRYTQRLLGTNISADDVYLAQRGLRTLAARLAMHEQAAIKIAEWLTTRKEVKSVLQPAFESHPDHALWKRDFSGSCGLFGCVLHETRQERIAAFFNRLQHFGMGYSWGGFESLCIPVWPEKYRTAVPWQEEGQMIRFHVGLEHVQNLMDDIDAAFAAMAAI